MAAKSKKLIVGIGLSAFGLFAVGFAFAINALAHVNFAKLAVGLALMIVSRGVVYLLSPPRSRRRRKRKKRSLTAMALMEIGKFSLVIFVSVVALGLFLWCLPIALKTLSDHGVSSNWWKWGIGAVLTLMTAFYANRRCKTRRQERTRGKFVLVVGLVFLAGFVRLWLGGVDSAKVDEAAACPIWYDLEMREPAGCKWFPVQNFFNLSRVGRIQVGYEIANGKIPEALRTTHDLARLSRLLLEHAESVSTWFCAVAFRDQADGALMEIIASGKATADELREMENILSLTESPSLWDMDRLVRVGYANFSAKILPAVKASYFKGPIAVDSILGRYLYQPERVRRMFIRLGELAQPLLAVPGYDQAAWAGEKERAETVLKGAGGALWRNFVGEAALRALAVDWEAVAKARARTESVHSAVRQALAAEISRRKNGEFCGIILP